jgi:hypothetical protein
MSRSYRSCYNLLAENTFNTPHPIFNPLALHHARVFFFTAVSESFLVWTFSTLPAYTNHMLLRYPSARNDNFIELKPPIPEIFLPSALLPVLQTNNLHYWYSDNAHDGVGLHTPLHTRPLLLQSLKIGHCFPGLVADRQFPFLHFPIDAVTFGQMPPVESYLTTFLHT